MSTIHADKASSIPMRMYSLLESSQDTDQFLSSIHRYVQLGIYVKGYMSKKYNRFQREILEVCEFYVDDDNNPKTNIIYKKSLDGTITFNNPTQHLRDYCSIGGVELSEDPFHQETPKTGPVSKVNPLADNTNVTPMQTSTQNVGVSPTPVQATPQRQVFNPQQAVNNQQVVRTVQATPTQNVSQINTNPQINVSSPQVRPIVQAQPMNNPQVSTNNMANINSIQIDSIG